ncbi:hypothetical protein MS3_00001033 [Schistosoma haematobium]|uniref:Uncharacterized protein n=1 Tax=Schistosoma haematobium TaxID=6185 RepID=A0A922LLT7_SCHHA|nr:hypothetical protein MS3_00001033 [Schistosoma haematobium]KAH9589509.1 hypothetical protein MS3_00001033 [Schistosoma haematobium]
MEETVSVIVEDNDKICQHHHSNIIILNQTDIVVDNDNISQPHHSNIIILNQRDETVSDIVVDNDSIPHHEPSNISADFHVDICSLSVTNDESHQVSSVKSKKRKYLLIASLGFVSLVGISLALFMFLYVWK